MLTATRTGPALAAAVAALALLTSGAASPARADSPHDCGLEVCIPADNPGSENDTNGNSGTGGPSGPGDGARQECTAGNAIFAFHSESNGTFDQGTGCYAEPADPQPPATDPVWQGREPGTGTAYTVYCPVLDMAHLEWRAGPPTGPTADELAQQVLARLRLDPPPMHLTPGPGKETLVSVPVWLWTDRGPHTWGPLSETASAPGLSVTGTATATSIAWNMGDGTTVTCHTPGSPYPGGANPSPDCGHAYQRVSTTAPGGAYTVTATTTWTIPWAATNGQAGTFTATRTAGVADIRVGELQVLNN